MGRVRKMHKATRAEAGQGEGGTAAAKPVLLFANISCRNNVSRKIAKEEE